MREIIGLDRQAVLEAFSDFMFENKLNANQTHFVRMIMDYVEQNGYLERTEFTKDPFKSVGSIIQLFDDNQAQVRQLLQVVDKINNNAEMLVELNQKAD